MLTSNKMQLPEVPVTYPKLMENLAKDIVVLFHDEKQGVVVEASKDSGWNVGAHRTDFFMPHFTDYNGIVTLRNLK